MDDLKMFCDNSLIVYLFLQQESKLKVIRKIALQVSEF